MVVFLTTRVKVRDDTLHCTSNIVSTHSKDTLLIKNFKLRFDVYIFDIFFFLKIYF